MTIKMMTHAKQQQKSTRLSIISALIILALFALLSAEIIPSSYADTNITSAATNTSVNTNASTSFVKTIECGNGVCEIAENKYNCPQDCSMNRVDAVLSQENLWLAKNDAPTISLNLENTQNTTYNLKIASTENLGTKINLTEKITLAPFEKRSVPVSIIGQDKISNQNLTDYYAGEIVITYLNEKIILPLLINIAETETEVLKLSSTPLTDQISTPTLPIKVVISKKSSNPEDLIINYKVYNSNNAQIFETTEIKQIKSRYEDIKFLDVKNAKEGTYTLLTQVSYNKQIYQTKSDFYFKEVFWTEQRLNILIFSLIAVIVIFVLIYGYIRYRKYKHEKIRYLQPNMHLIPHKTPEMFDMGLIAGSKKERAFYNPADLTTHVLVSGSTGSGKSVSASILVEEALIHNVSVVIFDPTAQWTGFLKPCADNNLLKFYKLFGLKENDARGFKGLIYNATSPNIELNFSDYMNPGEVTVFNLSNLGPGEYDLAVSNIISAMFKVKWEESPELKLLVVFDEVHRLLEKYGGKGGYVSLEKACREFRKWGIGLVMASQVSTDFKDAIQGNILTEIQLNTKNLDDIKKVGEKYGDDYSKRITRQGIGVGLVQNPKYNEGKPWFVHFRPTLHSPHKMLESELKQYQEYAEKIKQLEKQLEKSKSKNLDDISLELKLAKNKLKEGHFKMTQMYIKNVEEATKNLK